MPINNTCESVVKDYILNERPQSELLEEQYKDTLFLSLQYKRMDPKAIRQLVKNIPLFLWRYQEKAVIVLIN